MAKDEAAPHWRDVRIEDCAPSTSLKRASRLHGILTLGSAVDFGDDLGKLSMFGEKVVAELWDIVDANKGQSPAFWRKVDSRAKVIRYAMEALALPSAIFNLRQPKGDPVESEADRLALGSLLIDRVEQIEAAFDLWPALATFRKGDLVKREPVQCWRGKVVAAFEMPNGPIPGRTDITYCVESTFEPGTVIMIPEHQLQVWMP